MTLDRDVVQAVEQLRRREGLGLSAALNELARRGLARPQNEPARFVQRTSSMGRPRVPLDNIAEALDALEGEAHR